MHPMKRTPALLLGRELIGSGTVEAHLCPDQH